MPLNPRWAHNAAEYAVPAFKTPANGEGERLVEAFMASVDCSADKRTFLARRPREGDGSLVYYQAVNAEADCAITRVLAVKRGGTLERAEDIVEVRHTSKLLSQPSFDGLVVVKEGKNYSIRRIDENAEDKFETRYWDLGRREPNRFEAYGDTLDFTTVPDKKPSWWANSIPNHLVCMDLGDQPGDSSIRWEYNLTEQWKESQEFNLALHLGRSFHLTSKVAVFSVCRVPSHLSGASSSNSEFHFVSLKDGSINKIPLAQAVYTPVPSNINLHRALWTSASSHDFVVTDTHIISGGPGGHLFVWSYWTDFRPFYILPDKDVKGNMPAPYTNLSLSTDGRLVIGTVSDYLIVWDMITKTILGSWTSGKNSPPTRTLPPRPPPTSPTASGRSTATTPLPHTQTPGRPPTCKSPTSPTRPSRTDTCSARRDASSGAGGSE